MAVEEGNNSRRVSDSQASSSSPKRPILGVKWDVFSSKNVTVSGLRHGGLAERCGFEVGMELLAIEGQPITDPESLDQGLQRVQQIGRGTFTVRKKQPHAVSRFVHITDSLDSREHLPRKPDITLYIGGGERVPITLRATTDNITSALKWLTRNGKNIRLGEDSSWLLIVEDSKHRAGHSIGSILCGMHPPPGALLTVLSDTDSLMDGAIHSFRYLLKGGSVCELPEPPYGCRPTVHGSCVVVSLEQPTFIQKCLSVLRPSGRGGPTTFQNFLQLFQDSPSPVPTIHSSTFIEPSDAFSLSCSLVERMNGLEHWEQILSEKTKMVEELERRNRAGLPSVFSV
eukprot:TRINITY_DN11134_c0_g1_i1.p1 TRINITY_DN11134_c0_g1~~TRINITY_DN11134_c0_g1_i1.p1  ORF type:complete len:380 (+),score=65.42 TRINITY_DN11134_c0_g1_i1:115-1140(+)